MEGPEGMPDFADPEHGLTRLTEVWSEELEEAAVCMALSPKGQLLAIGTVEDAISVLDVATGKEAHRLAGHRGGTNGVAFLSGNTLVSVGEDGTARIWNVGRGTCMHELPVDGEGADRNPGGHSVNHLTVAPGDTSFACASGQLVTAFTLGSSASAKPTKRMLGPLGSTVEGLRFDRLGNLLATYNGGVSYWRVADRADRQELPLPYAGACLCGDVKPGNDYIVAGCHDETVHIWHFKQERDGGVELEEMTCGGYDTKVTAVEFNAAGDRMASIGGDKNILWDFGKGSPSGTVPTLAVGHMAPLTCQAWLPDMESGLATGGKDGRLYIFDVTDAASLGPGNPLICQPGAIGLADGDEVTTLLCGMRGLLFTGHISGRVRKWEIPEADSSEHETDSGSEEEEEEEDAEQH